MISREEDSIAGPLIPPISDLYVREGVHNPGIIHAYLHAAMHLHPSV